MLDKETQNLYIWIICQNQIKWYWSLEEDVESLNLPSIARPLDYCIVIKSFLNSYSTQF